LRLPLLALKKFSYHVDKTQKLVAIKLSDASDNLRLVEMPSYILEDKSSSVTGVTRQKAEAPLRKTGISNPMVHPQFPI
jgi:hypothetical protein